jgi:transposase
MKCVVRLSEAEETTLQQLSINHKHRDTRTRAAGLLMLGRRIKPKVIALQLGVSGQTVYNWSHTWRDSGVCGLMGGHNGGRPPALSDAMVAAALEVARAEPLTLAKIAQRVQAILGEPLPCQIETLGEALKREGFSFKRNRYALKKSGQFSPKAAHTP